MSPVCAIVLLCLLSLGHSAPLACEDLVRPLHQLDPHHLEGRRALVAGSLSHVPFMERLKQRESATAGFSISANETNISLFRDMRADNKCHYVSYNISLEGSSFTFADGNITTTFIYTSCPDCILMSFDVESGKRQHFYLFSKRRELEPREIEEFKAQVECLSMPPPVVMDPTKELCPEKKVDTSS
ncbi:hypothetical protein L3Q82_005414 [Scortum barcoo]|uniref:Uncharacterized protein n=1 Tax=Scortum barcoo TaxID=214431 RepID=A0ACB8V9Y3_9TELE|nr:hypothetical protein L3Q82_005414 [Scortum barcoo]